MKKIPHALTMAFIVLTSPLAFAASSTDLTVTGTITPNACVPLLSEGGNVHHGKISSKDLNQDKQTRLTDKTLQLTVNCDSAIAFRLKPIDNRDGSDADGGAGFGLGLINGDVNQKIGYIDTRFVAPLGDGTAVMPIFSNNNGGTWGAFPGLIPKAISAFATVGGPNTPIAIKDFQTGLQIRTYIARADSLDFSNEVAINGSVTLEVLYP
ncbi:hypothetical protein DJ564_06115 [Pseudomonas sp. 31-12]|uniref:DUF1120 domain-containing protein n=1 Tax=Pseudomonas sp. 31-12 TaxID=2201356 RepID=UPI000D6BE483|nr:DUF1120 domain-containing protein [Pseudomonas sp. 31-12]AWM90424.1 hypothetical protein DJ564_06115 [Pseudomonas sp. 31-12]